LTPSSGHFWVYILENPAGKFYVGHTDDLKRRITEHNDSSADGHQFAPKNGPWRLIWSESHTTRASAMNRERQIKRMKPPQWIREHLLGSTQVRSKSCSRRMYVHLYGEETIACP
jgi:predicted GIY-YIG superfamily endonuclease